MRHDLVLLAPPEISPRQQGEFFLLDPELAVDPSAGSEERKKKQIIGAFCMAGNE